MFINKTIDNKNNVCGKNIARFRKELQISQRALADKLQLVGLDVDKNAIQRIESRQRFVTDIELTFFGVVFNKTIDELVNESDSLQMPCQDKYFV